MTRQKNVMKFFKDPKNWRNELAAIGLSVGTVMFLLSFLVLGVPTVWLLVALCAVVIAVAFRFLAENETSSPAYFGDFCMDYLLLAN